MHEEIKQGLNFLYENGAKELHNLCHKEMARFGGISSKDYDDFYSRVNYEITVAQNNYEPSKGDFLDYIAGTVKFAIWKEMTYRNRKKRQNVVEKVEIDSEGNTTINKEFVQNISLDEKINDSENITIGMMQLDETAEVERTANLGIEWSEEGLAYLDSLTKVQRQIAERLAMGYTKNEIKKELKLSNNQYNCNFQALTSFEKIKIISGKSGEENIEMNTTTTQTMENCKTDKISIASVIKRIDRNTIRFNHPLQRESDQWSPAMKGNLISDILQGNRLHPLIFAEQIINGVPIIWDLDGKQRCTNAYSFAKNGYKVSKNIRRWMITYQTTEKDENGNEILDENGFPIAQNEEFDIRGKRFSDLPEELQEKFLDYTFNYDQYLNCSEADIGYHIERYNDGKPMTKSQKGITKLGTEYAEMVKAIANMPFFKEIGGYKASEFRNGTIDRVVVESVMTANFLKDWKKELDEHCKFLKENADISVFENFEDMINRLEKVVTEETADMFDSKDSFIYFALFARFIETGLEDEKFIEFLKEFTTNDSMHHEEINGTTYEDLCIDKSTGKTRSTKDKNIVVPKIEVLEILMLNFFGIETESDKEINTIEFVKENVKADVTDEDIDFYSEVLDELTLEVDNDTKLLDEHNRPSLTALVGYACENDIDLDEWIVSFFEKNSEYIKNQKENYLYMKKNVDSFLSDKVA